MTALLRLVARETREFLEGDLEEGYRRRLARGRTSALRWYGSQVVRSILAGVRQPRGPGAIGSGPDGLARDLRDALRALRREPGIALVVVATLALGLGVNTATLAVADAVLFRPLPYPDSDGLLWIHAAGLEPRDRYGALSWQDVERLRKVPVGLSVVGAYSPADRTVEAPGVEPLELDFARVTGGFFDALDIHMALGRPFTPEELRGGLPVVILSHAFWTERMAADPGALGREVLVRGVVHRVVGVTDAEAAFPAGAAFWRPLTVEERSDDDRELRVLGRLAPGSTVARVNARLRETSSEVAPSDEPLTLWAETLRSTLVHEARTPILVLLGGSWLVLLGACANVGGLLLARGRERRHALAVRAALGAARGRLVRLQLLESGILAVAGGLVGVGAGALALPALVALAPADTPRLAGAAVDPRIGVAMAGVVLLTILVAGAAPAVGASSVPPRDALSTSGRGSLGADRRASLLRRGLVIAQVAVSTALAIGAVLVVGTVMRMATSDTGFDPAGVLAVELHPSAGAVAAAGGGSEYRRRVLEAATDLPGIRAAAVGSQTPVEGRGINARLFGLGLAEAPGRGSDGVGVVEVTAGFFGATGMRVVAGRGLAPTDGGTGTPAAVVNRRFAEAVLGGEPPAAVGRRLTAVDLRTGRPLQLSVVGVVEDARPDPRVRPNPLVYLPWDPWNIAYGTLLLDVAGDPTSVVPALRARLHDVDSGLPLNRITRLEDPVRGMRASPRFVAQVLTVFGGMALLLAMLGSYGVVAWAVVRRAPELGVRRALGARSSQVATLVLRQAGATVLPGAVLGLGGALAASRLLSSLLFGLSPLEPGVYAVVPLAVTLAALAAAGIPALRAARTHPMEVLRQE